MDLTNAKSPISYSRHTDQSSRHLWGAAEPRARSRKAQGIVHEFERHLLTQNYSLSVNWWQRIVVHHRKVKGCTSRPAISKGRTDRRLVDE